MRTVKGRTVNPQAGQQIGRLEIVLAFVFGCAALAAVLWLAFRSDSLSSQQFEILRIVLALAGGGVGAVVPGFLDLHLKAGASHYAPVAHWPCLSSYIFGRPPIGRLSMTGPATNIQKDPLRPSKAATAIPPPIMVRSDDNETRYHMPARAIRWLDAGRCCGAINRRVVQPDSEWQLQHVYL
jgi:hypothetical protein